MVSSSGSISVRCGSDVITGTSGTNSTSKATLLAMLNSAKAQALDHQPPCDDTVADLQVSIDLLNA